MPELMLCYRSATLFTRLYAPEVTMGIQTSEELADLAVNLQLRRPLFELASGKCESNGTNGNPGGRKGKQGRAPAQIALAKGQANKMEPAENSFLQSLMGLIRLSEHSEAEVLRFLRHTRKCDESVAGLAEVADKQPDAIQWACESWTTLDQELTRLKEGRGA